MQASKDLNVHVHAFVLPLLCLFELSYFDIQTKNLTGNLALLSWGQTQSGAKQQSEEGNHGDNWVMYRGSLLDVENLLQRLERSERNRKATEQKLQDQEHEVGEIHEFLVINRKLHDNN